MISSDQSEQNKLQKIQLQGEVVVEIVVDSGERGQSFYAVFTARKNLTKIRRSRGKPEESTRLE